MKSITDTESFKIAEGEAHILSLTSQLAVPENVVQREQIQQDLTWFERRYREPMKNDVLAALADKRVVLLYNKEDGIKMPRFFPMWTMAGPYGTPVTYVNLSHFATLVKDSPDNELTIIRGRLYGLLHAATVLHAMVTRPERFVSSAKLLQNLAVVYSRFVGQVVDRQYGLGSQPQVMDQVAYAIAKFFLIGMMDKQDDERVSKMAEHAVVKGTTRVALDNADNHFAGSYKSLSTFLEAMQSFSPRFKDDLNSRLVMREITRWYTIMGWLGADSPHYFVMNMLFALNQSGLNNDARLENIVGKEGGAAYMEIVRLMK